MQTLLGVLLNLLAFSACTAGQVPQFRSFPAEPVYSGPSVKPALDRPEMQSFRSRIEEGAKHPVNFGGHYHFTVWGCGSGGCVSGAITNALNGKTIMLPFSICCFQGPAENQWRPIVFKENSRLIVSSGVRNEQGINGVHFYSFDERGFHHLRSEQVSPAENNL